MTIPPTCCCSPLAIASQLRQNQSPSGTSVRGGVKQLRWNPPRQSSHSIMISFPNSPQTWHSSTSSSESEASSSCSCWSSSSSFCCPFSSLDLLTYTSSPTLYSTSWNWTLLKNTLLLLLLLLFPSLFVPCFVLPVVLGNRFLAAVTPPSNAAASWCWIFFLELGFGSSSFCCTRETSRGDFLLLRFSKVCKFRRACDEDNPFGSSSPTAAGAIGFRSNNIPQSSSSSRARAFASSNWRRRGTTRWWGGRGGGGQSPGVDGDNNGAAMYSTAPSSSNDFRFLEPRGLPLDFITKDFWAPSTQWKPTSST